MSAITVKKLEKLSHENDLKVSQIVLNTRKMFGA